MRKLLYVVYPVAPTEQQVKESAGGVLQWDPTVPGGLLAASREASTKALSANILSALGSLGWLRKSFPETSFIAPWLANLLGEAPVSRLAGFVDACATVERCDGIVFVGPQVSDEMLKIANHGATWRVFQDEDGGHGALFDIYDLTAYQADRNEDSRTLESWINEANQTFEQWVDGRRRRT